MSDFGYFSHRRPDRNRNRFAADVANERFRRAGFVNYEDAYRNGFDPEGKFNALPEAVWLKEPHSSDHGILPRCLVGRIVGRQGRTVEVWFWNRGVYKVATDAVQRG